DWNTIAMPRAAGGRAVTSRPPMQTVPEVGASRPAMMRSVVDLPQPEGPSSTQNEPASTSNEMPSSARDSPQCLATFSSLMADTGAFSPKMTPPYRPCRESPAMLLWFVIIYWIISVGIGIYAAKFVHNTRDYAIAGRRMPMYIVTATVFATWFGSETVLGIPATFMKEGFSGIIADPFGSSLCL